MWQTNKSNNVKALKFNGMESSVSVQVHLCLFKDAMETHLKWTKSLKKESDSPLKKELPMMFSLHQLQFWCLIWMVSNFYIENY